MYIELENSYNNNGLISLENNLDEAKRALREKFNDAKAMYKNGLNQDRHLQRHESKNNKVNGRIS